MTPYSLSNVTSSSSIRQRLYTYQAKRAVIDENLCFLQHIRLIGDAVHQSLNPVLPPCRQLRLASSLVRPRRVSYLWMRRRRTVTFLVGSQSEGILFGGIQGFRF